MLFIREKSLTLVERAIERASSRRENIRVWIRLPNMCLSRNWEPKAFSTGMLMTRFLRQNGIVCRVNPRKETFPYELCFEEKVALRKSSILFSSRDYVATVSTKINICLIKCCITFLCWLARLDIKIYTARIRVCRDYFSGIWIQVSFFLFLFKRSRCYLNHQTDVTSFMTTARQYESFIHLCYFKKSQQGAYHWHRIRC